MNHKFHCVSTYDEQTAEDLYMRLPDYLPRLSALADRLKQTLLPPSPRRAGFTLIELLVVVGIIGILVGLIVGVSGFANRKSATGKALAEMEKIKTALEEYRLDKSYYPTATTNLSILTNYIADLNFTDPWGTAYQYEQTGPFSFRLWSRGPNATNTFDDIDSASGEF